ncbi:hypothetical protein [Streptomyces wuyuanensis]|uniref:Uncharacterized protein n=1 Tax=Streptomyces wuyuanensis TaxID=1196353 RepID=A0A1G9VZS0_9ACTN|nr:hypothetical protein [Streptomyces wuyuanensis]SDM77305.1 hypothetical protein SAMN05444921_11352 [Streptomyces wuyuanensis]
MARIESPDPQFTGTGPGGIHFQDGVAETDNPAIIGYCQGAGYKVNGEALTDNPPAARVTAVPDPRFVQDVGDTAPLRDAAVDPRPGDVPPSNAGIANPHGPLVVAPGIGAPPVVEAPDGDGVVPATEVNQEPPARSASKATWVEYAVAQGLLREDAEKATRDQLADRYSGGGEG